MTNAEIKVGVRCNNNCVFCLNDSREWELDIKGIKSEVDVYVAKGAQTLSFTGGEVTIRKDFLDIVYYALSKCKGVTIQTNGRALSYKKIVNWMKGKPIYFLISMHAHTPELYKKITKTDGYEQVMKGIENIKKAGLKLGVNTVVCKENIDMLPDIARHHTELGSNMVQLSWVRPQGKSKNSLIPFSPENIEKLKESVEFLLEEKQRFGIIGIPPCILPEYNKYKTSPYSNMIVRTSATTENAERVNSLRKKHYEKCNQCSIKEQCSGIYKEYPEEYAEFLKPFN